MSESAATIEALLFLSSDPVSAEALMEAVPCEEGELEKALSDLEEGLAASGRGLVLRRIAGGYTLASAPEAEAAARRLFAKPRTPPLTAAQAETLAIVAYLQPVSRPEITRIRGVAADSATGTLLERGLIEESGRSQFGAVTYRTTELFLRLFGMDSIDELPDVAQWDPSPEEQSELRERLLAAGSARLGEAPGSNPEAAPELGEPEAAASRDGEASGSQAPDSPDGAEEPAPEPAA